MILLFQNYSVFRCISGFSEYARETENRMKTIPVPKISLWIIGVVSMLQMVGLASLLFTQ